MKAKTLTRNLLRRKTNNQRMRGEIFCFTEMRGARLYRGRLENNEVRYRTKHGIMQMIAGEYAYMGLNNAS